MNELITVSNAEYVSDYVIGLTFSDGVRANIDFSAWIDKYPFFAPLRDLTYFRNFSLDGWTVAWPNGADIAPETLYEIALKSQVPIAA